jgi:rod shape-determining protein MreD
VKYLIYLGVGILIILFQVLISRFLSIAGASPDFLLIFLIWITIREGQFVGETSGFALGLLLDVFAAGILGAHALSKTVACFLVGFFYDPERVEQNVRNWPFLILTLLGAVINNALYYLIYTKNSEISFTQFAFTYGVVGALYTVVFSILPLLYWSRKRAF